MKTPSRIAALYALLPFTLTSPVTLAQGDLTPPPGIPKPEMKTLQQIEPRIDLQNAPSAAVTTTDANSHYKINLPGSYYLSANLGVTKNYGIYINAAGVTLDLNGFEISRESGSGGSGIYIFTNCQRGTVRNGSLRGFSQGIESFSSNCLFRDLGVQYCSVTGISAGSGAVIDSCRAVLNSGNAAIEAGYGASLSNCTAFGNTTTYAFAALTGSTLTNCAVNTHNKSGSTAIFAGNGSTLTNCSATENNIVYGIYAGEGSTLSNCSASNNAALYGIRAESGSSLLNCTAKSNTSSFASSAGIWVGTDCSLSNCSSSQNSTTSAPSTSSTGMGFYLSEGCKIDHSTANRNRGDGIYMVGTAVALENTCSFNGNGGTGAGIHAINGRNLIESNSVNSNSVGIDVDNTGNIILKNTAGGNTTFNWDIVAGNICGPIVDRTVPPFSPLIQGNSGASSAGTTDPHANFTY